MCPKRNRYTDRIPLREGSSAGQFHTTCPMRNRNNTPTARTCMVLSTQRSIQRNPCPVRARLCRRATRQPSPAPRRKCVPLWPPPGGAASSAQAPPVHARVCALRLCVYWSGEQCWQGVCELDKTKGGGWGRGQKCDVVAHEKQSECAATHTCDSCPADRRGTPVRATSATSTRLHGDGLTKGVHACTSRRYAGLCTLVSLGWFCGGHDRGSQDQSPDHALNYP